MLHICRYLNWFKLKKVHRCISTVNIEMMYTITSKVFKKPVSALQMKEVTLLLWRNQNSFITSWMSNRVTSNLYPITFQHQHFNMGGQGILFWYNFIRSNFVMWLVTILCQVQTAVNLKSNVLQLRLTEVEVMFLLRRVYDWLIGAPVNLFCPDWLINSSSIKLNTTRTWAQNAEALTVTAQTENIKVNHDSEHHRQS